MDYKKFLIIEHSKIIEGLESEKLSCCRWAHPKIEKKIGYVNNLHNAYQTNCVLTQISPKEDCQKIQNNYVKAIERVYRAIDDSSLCECE